MIRRLETFGPGRQRRMLVRPQRSTRNTKIWSADECLTGFQKCDPMGGHLRVWPHNNYARSHASTRMVHIDARVFQARRFIVVSVLQHTSQLARSNSLLVSPYLAYIQIQAIIAWCSPSTHPRRQTTRLSLAATLAGITTPIHQSFNKEK